MSFTTDEATRAITRFAMELKRKDNTYMTVNATTSQITAWTFPMATWNIAWNEIRNMRPPRLTR